ncbi:MAG TPA: hemerythrin domain-containing protein [Usitatibacter sp.]|nr:hemerythrin domain-containing protein [Usitatibacter sp.]
MGSVPFHDPANDSHIAPEDIRDQLRKDHQWALAELESLPREEDERAGMARLRALRQAWVIHALAEESVVYRALESSHSSERADERFVEHELVGDLFSKMERLRAGSLEWTARLKVVSDLIRRHIASEENDMFVRLGRHFDEAALREMGERFRLAHDKLMLLESAKAA